MSTHKCHYCKRRRDRNDMFAIRVGRNRHAWRCRVIPGSSCRVAS